MTVDPHAADAPAAGRPVICYRCDRTLTVSPRAMSVFCPHCHQRLVTEDLHITRPQTGRELTTCGDVVVESNVRLNLQRLVGVNVLVRGCVVGPVLARKTVEVARTGRIEGNVQAASVVVHDGGVLKGACKIVRPPAPALPQPKKPDPTAPPPVPPPPTSLPPPPTRLPGPRRW